MQSTLLLFSAVGSDQIEVRYASGVCTGTCSAGVPGLSTVDPATLSCDFFGTSQIPVAFHCHFLISIPHLPTLFFSSISVISLLSLKNKTSRQTNKQNQEIKAWIHLLWLVLTQCQPKMLVKYCCIQNCIQTDIECCQMSSTVISVSPSETWASSTGYHHISAQLRARVLAASYKWCSTVSNVIGQEARQWALIFYVCLRRFIIPC